MKKILTLAILGVAGLTGAAGAEANDGHRGSEHRRPAEHHEQHRRERVWIAAPRYETRIVGTECGEPVYRSVCISEGYWTHRPACD